MKILLIDSDKKEQLVLIQQFFNLNYTDYDVAETLNDAEKLLEINQYSIIITNVHIENTTCFSLVNKKRYEDIPCVFVSHTEEMSNYLIGKNRKNSSYFVAPFHHLSLKASIMRLLKSKELEEEQFNSEIEVQLKKNVFKKILVQEILFIEVEGNYINIKTKKELITIRETLHTISEKTNGRLLQVHRKYLINPKFVDDVNVSKMSIKMGDDLIPIGKTYKSLLAELIYR